MFNRFLAFTFIATCALTTSANASDDRLLASVAAADGFTYAWLPTEGAVELTRPGLRIVLRAGRLFYEVNNATPIADRAPSFDGDDLLISPALAERLHRLSAASSPATEANAVRPARLRTATAVQPITTAVKLVPGRLALAVSGTGPANARIDLTLTAEMSKFLPVLTVRRTTVYAGANGTYAIEMGYGLDAHHGTRFIVTAASASGDARAIAHVTIDETINDNVPGVDSTSLDDWPKN